MPKKALLLLLLWNIVLTALVAGALMRPAPASPTATAVPDGTGTTPVVPRDTAAMRDARIAYFMMDSVRNRYEMLKESADRMRSEGRRLEDNLAKEMRKAQGRAEQLAAKDHTYSTKAELEADREEFEKLQAHIQDLREQLQGRFEDLQASELRKIVEELQDFLEEYNRGAGFDYIISIQPDGQVWTGNKGLDITEEVIAGLNERHRARKTAVKKAP